MHFISAIISTHNEAHNIGACLDSLAGVADEIIVVDDGSSDGTQEISAARGARVIQQRWLGFGPQKNFGAAQASHAYILSLDADEQLDPALQQAIREEKKRGLEGAYELDRFNQYYGRFIRHGLEYPDRKLRLYHREQASWNDSKVHETLQLAPGQRIRKLKGFLLHRAYPRFGDHVQKADRYTSLAAEQYFAEGRKVSLLKILFSPWATFVKAYFLRGGLLDGWHGYLLARMHAHAVFLKYVKLWDLHRRAKAEGHA